jgi:hypothetical protein
MSSTSAARPDTYSREKCLRRWGLNRWPGHAAAPIGEYLGKWEASCAELGASKQLPRRLREILHAA